MKHPAKHPSFPDKPAELKDFPNNKGYFMVVDGPTPDFDPDIERIEIDRENIDYENQQFIKVYRVVAMSQAEINAKMWSSSLEAGYTDPVLNIKLKTTLNAQSMLSQMITLISQGLSFGAITDSSQMAIWNYDNQEVALTSLEIRQLLFRYGLHCKNMFDLYAP